MLKLYIQLPPDFSFDECLVFLTRSDREILHRVQNKSLTKAFRIGHETCLTTISVKSDKMMLRFDRDISNEAARLIRSEVSEWFDLSCDLANVYRLMKKDPKLFALTKRFHGLRLIGIPDLFEALAWAVIGQQINLTFAYTLKQRLIDVAGQSLTHDGLSYGLFPDPTTVADLKVDTLRKLQFSTRKAEYLIHIARQIADKKIEKTALQNLSLSQIVERLTAERGIGAWTAHYVAMKCLRKANAFPIGDAGLHQAVFRIYQMKGKPTLKQVEKKSKLWQGCEAYAVFYLWRSLQET
ncbi:DNA-3-methyladenine glycosylase [bacterium]|nr:DNA-3-methyladenine glycosylase [bacterium]NUN44971.1 DNA-3-methyladenine glycosylase 2 family protein [bacterium]